MGISEVMLARELELETMRRCTNSGQLTFITSFIGKEAANESSSSSGIRRGEKANEGFTGRGTNRAGIMAFKNVNFAGFAAMSRKNVLKR